MKRSVMFLVTLVATSCAVAQVSPDVMRVVPLIKAEKYDEAAANPDLLAPAFVEALREMKAEGADPSRIVRVADYFFDNYPFCAKDLPIDESAFEAVSEAHFEATTKLIPALETCSSFENARTLQDMIEAFESWEKGHPDGGRCLHRVHALIKRLRRNGFAWFENAGLDRTPEKTVGGENELLDDLFKSAARVQPECPFLVLIAFSGSAISNWAEQQRRFNAWSDFSFRETPRWNRMFLGRAAWLGALRQPPVFEFDGAEDIAGSKLDPRLRKLGQALVGFRRHLYSQSPGAGDLMDAVAEIIQHGRGTPFPDMARQGVVVSLMETRQPKAADAWLRTHLKEFEHPSCAAQTLLELASRWTEGPIGRRVEYARMALDLDPNGSSSVQARLHIAEDLAGKGREIEAIAILEAALARGRNLTGLFEDENADLARSNVGQLLAELLQKHEKWTRALQAWKDWDLYTGCGTTDHDWEARYDGITTCLEKLGRPREALEYHWKAACSSYHMSRERAEKVKRVYASQGRLADLRELVRKKVEGIESWGKKIETEDSLKWLADELGVAVK